MSRHFACPSCRGFVKFNASLAGQHFPCPHCKHVMVMPASATKPPPRRAAGVTPATPEQLKSDSASVQQHASGSQRTRQNDYWRKRIEYGFVGIAVVIVLCSSLGNGSEHPKLAAFRKVLQKYQTFPDKYASSKSRKEFNKELDALQQEFMDTQIDVRADPDAAKVILGLYEAHIDGRYDGLLPIKLEGHMHNLLHDLWARDD